jgi:hypothetical protein
MNSAVISPCVLKLPCETGQVSDGYHTFEELYAHRSALFLALMAQQPEISWISNMHDDDSSFDGWFVAGMNLPTGQVTYHCPNGLWSLANRTGAKFVRNAPKWDGHTSNDVLQRIWDWIKK